jgi:hypothetical protein
MANEKILKLSCCSLYSGAEEISIAVVVSLISEVSGLPSPYFPPPPPSLPHSGGGARYADSDGYLDPPGGGGVGAGIEIGDY